MTFSTIKLAVRCRYLSIYYHFENWCNFRRFYDNNSKIVLNPFCYQIDPHTAVLPGYLKYIFIRDHHTLLTYYLKYITIYIQILPPNDGQLAILNYFFYFFSNIVDQGVLKPFITSILENRPNTETPISNIVQLEYLKFWIVARAQSLPKKLSKNLSSKYRLNYRFPFVSKLLKDLLSHKLIHDRTSSPSPKQLIMHDFLLWLANSYRVIFLQKCAQRFLSNHHNFAAVLFFSLASLSISPNDLMLTLLSNRA